MPRVKVISRKLPENDTRGGEKAKYKVRKDGKLDTGRPTKKTPEVLEKLHNAFKVNCTEEEACSHAGISVATLDMRKANSEDFTRQIQMWKKEYYYEIKNASFQRAKNVKNRDSTDILFKIDKSYSDKQDIDVKGELSLVGIAKAMQQKRLDREKGEDVK